MSWPFAIAKRGPTHGVTGKVRKSTAGPENPPAMFREPDTSSLSVRTLAIGHGRGRTEWPRTWATLPQAVDTPHPLLPPTTYSNYCKKTFFFFCGFRPRQDPPQDAPNGRGDGRATCLGGAR